MNTQLQLALELLDRSEATYVVTHPSLKAPVFSDDRVKPRAKFVAAQHVRRSKKHTQIASKWRALLSDIQRGGTKELRTPDGVTISNWQARVAGACISVFGPGASSTARLPDGSAVRVTRK